MPFFDESEHNRVFTYDGYRAMQRPRLVLFESVEYAVIECESLYISTGESTNSAVKRGFGVRCSGGRQFELELIEGKGWRIKPLPGPFAASDD